MHDLNVCISIYILNASAKNDYTLDLRAMYMKMIVERVPFDVDEHAKFNQINWTKWKCGKKASKPKLSIKFFHRQIFCGRFFFTFSCSCWDVFY